MEVDDIHVRLGGGERNPREGVEGEYSEREKEGQRRYHLHVLPQGGTQHHNSSRGLHPQCRLKMVDGTDRVG